ncbi:outer membrane lipoprotein-sorting protein [Aestuariibacter sp. AA17]|uniref:Outer membrane lipoprotein-sorting protein n=1 Tax=Fluctibacter corallii TaxID=2984329 RepID=A0ABT3ACH9_9ALTE|nr:outer membrane lipoprotein-sorting protein [Aestuariibacter sp. AA17]MCV2886325.1 outer membrane lipoprotein-sorting protein [Aestuariibacter sp. AA17]
MHFQINTPIAIFLALACCTVPPTTSATSGLEVMQQVNARDDGNMIQRRFVLELTNKDGKTKTEKTRSYRRYFGDEKRTVIFYEEPTRVRGTGFLTFDYPDPSVDDDQWLYLPALRKVRRISASDRGDYFLGTDFTYEDIKKEQKVEIDDYTFTDKGMEYLDGRTLHVVEGVPVNEQIEDELGYSRAIWYVDPTIWMSRKTELYDVNGNHAKTITIEVVEVIDGIITATRILATNHKTGHSTRLTFSDVDYQSDVPESLFTQARLRRGL